MSGELQILKYLDLFYRDKIILFDIGANKGQYALAASKILTQTPDIYCFEPSKKTFQMLSENVKSILNIRTYNIGLSNKIESLTLYRTGDGSGLSSIYNNNPITHFIYEEEINLITLDNFCKQNSIETINLLKLDVEGHEYKVLTGGSVMMASGKIDFIQFEIGECNLASKIFFKDFFDILSPQYKIYRILPGGLRLVKNYKLSNEIFACVNFLAVNKKLNHKTIF